jgi:hypothetical protein
VEWLGEEGSGASTLALVMARQSWQTWQRGKTLVVVDRQRRFYPPAAAALGIDLQSIVVARPRTLLDHEWTLNQALRCPAVAAVLCWPQKVDSRAFRRLQLSAEKGGSLGLILRGAAAIREPSWADVRLLVHPLRSPERRRFQVEVLRCRGSVCGRSVEVEINDEGLLNDADPLHSIPELAPATAHQRSTRA